MHSLPKSAHVFAICLSALAGCVDAIGFLELSGHFVSFMSGNTTQLAVGLATGPPSMAVTLAGIIGSFVFGTMLGTWMRLFSSRRFSHPKAPILALLMLMTTLLGTAGLAQEMGGAQVAIAFMTLAMGAENAIFQRNGDTVIGLTYMTGTLVKMGQRLAHALLGEGGLAWLPYFLLWVGLLSGGVLGALLFQSLQLHSLWFASGASAALTVAMVFLKGPLH